MSKFILLLVATVWLTGCATTTGGKNFEQRYDENVKVVQTCMFNSIVGVLSVIRSGFDGFSQVCNEKPKAKYTR